MLCVILQSRRFKGVDLKIGKWLAGHLYYFISVSLTLSFVGVVAFPYIVVFGDVRICAPTSNYTYMS